MENTDFDSLMRCTIAKRCDKPMPENMASRIIERSRNRSRKLLWMLIPAAAASIAAVVVVSSSIRSGTHTSARQDHVPSFYVEIEELTMQRTNNTSAVSAQLRKDIDELYILSQQ